MEIRIHSQIAQLGLDISKPQMSMQISEPFLKMKTEQPELMMKQATVSLTIDQDKCFEDVNRRKIIPFGIYSRDQAIAKTDQAIAEIVREGNQLRDIEKGYTVAIIAKQEMDTMKDFNMDFIPKHRPEIRVNRTPLEMSYQPGAVRLDLKRGEVKVDLKYGDVKVHYIKRPSVEITTVPSKFDRTI